MNTEESVAVNRHSIEDIKKRLALWRESGKSQIAFSKEHGINYYTFNKWVNDEKRKVKKPKGFTEVKVTPVSSSGLFAEIKKEGVTIVLHQMVSADFLRYLIK